ncbi:glycoside hydrolase family 99-like domain-containing protein [Desulfocurvibacter africanus]|uniref:Glycosyl transferase family 2 n=1 Tax=Desulfocurvibacter africanus subsp. africanus str. Walvis Bay TaxID=690850 RepID=F3YZF2_DESAF|nr:glycoside hydrolase family 99-like domain-containing protein [Desulfocurvibacter africanus]EGJ51981.1 glycosyl transferase family 2 [Desulfocurvibacter africanus subsp. africanus str. Walvis Bay]
MEKRANAAADLHRLLVETGLFDARYYLLSNQDVAASGMNPLEHFLTRGGFEGRNPSRHFDVFWYVEQNPELLQQKINPLIHYLVQGRQEGRLPMPPTTRDTETGPCHEFERVPAGMDRRVRLIAFYLPQFHPIPENDKHWGKGFTEWNNVVKARPVFTGHYQPRLPGELGFYDLRVKDVLRRQMELARQYGIHGFCLHHYWFFGRKLLRTPLEHILADKSLDLPFCLHWANESWSRRWDGRVDSELLIRQRHSPEDDIRFIKDIEPALRDERYIRIDGKPLLGVYRADEFPDLRATAERWREYCVRAGIGEIYLAMSQSFRNKDPRPYGFDAAVEYPPHDLCAPFVKEKRQILDEQYGGVIRLYADAADFYLGQDAPFKRFRGVAPAWDNSPRSRFGQILADSSPTLYQRWLEGACRRTLDEHAGDERIVFINAWNEWAESAYLEPDGRYGYAYLNATARTLQRLSGASPVKILIVAWDADPGRANDVLREFLRQGKATGRVDAKLVFLAGGALREEFQQFADTLVLEEVKGDLDARLQRIQQICQGHVHLVLSAAPAAGDLHTRLNEFGAPVLSMICEEVREIPGKVGLDAMDATVRQAQHFVAGSQAMLQYLVQQHAVPEENISILPDQTAGDWLLNLVETRKVERQPYVSAILVVDNAAEHLAQTLDTVLCQSFNDMEILCVDNASSDGSAQILRTYAHHGRLRILRLENRRANYATLLAEAFQNVTGECVWVVHPGDFHGSSFLEKLIPCFGDGQVSLAYCAVQAADALGAPILPSAHLTQFTSRKQPHGYRIPGAFELSKHLVTGNRLIPTPSCAIFRRSRLGEFLAGAAKIKAFPDWYLCLCLAAGGDIAYTPYVLCHHRERQASPWLLSESRPEQLLAEYALLCQFILEHFSVEEPIFKRMLARADELTAEAGRSSPGLKAERYLDKGRLEAAFRRRVPARQPQRTKKIYDVFRAYTAEEWLDVLCRSIRTPIIHGVQFPGFPPEKLQVGMVGSAYEQSLLEVFKFYKEIHKYADSAGIAFDENTTICDFGCGFGRIYRFFLKDVPQQNLVGVDVDPSFLEICRQLIPMGRFYRNTPMPLLGFRNEGFDIVYAYSVFSHLAETASLAWIEEMNRVLKPGGLLFATVRQTLFLEQCHQLTFKVDASDYEKQLARLFGDRETLREKYARGEFIYEAEETTGVRTADFYGDCVIPSAYIARMWTRNFTLLDCFEDPHRCAQSLVVLQKQKGRT